MRSVHRILCICVFGLLHGCESTTPSCGDPRTIDLLKRIVKDEFVKKKSDAFIRDSAYRDLSAIQVDVSDILTQSVNKDIGRYSCKATLSIDLSEENFKALSVQYAAITPQAKLEHPLSATVEFTSQLSEDKKHFVELSGSNKIQESLADRAEALALFDSKSSKVASGSSSTVAAAPEATQTVQHNLPTDGSESEDSTSKARFLAFHQTSGFTVGNQQVITQSVDSIFRYLSTDDYQSGHQATFGGDALQLLRERKDAIIKCVGQAAQTRNWYDDVSFAYFTSGDAMWGLEHNLHPGTPGARFMEAVAEYRGDTIKCFSEFTEINLSWNPYLKSNVTATGDDIRTDTQLAEEAQKKATQDARAADEKAAFFARVNEKARESKDQKNAAKLREIQRLRDAAARSANPHVAKSNLDRANLLERTLDQ